VGGEKIFLFIMLLGCSTMGRFFGMAPSPEVKNGGQDQAGKEIREFFTTVRPQRGNPESHYQLAKYYQERGKHRQAISEFEKVLYIDPG
jgi:tetratricopeptide (TPR) repeat protein